MKTTVLWVALFCAACAGFVGWRVHAVRTQDPPHFEIVLDPSLSHPTNCDSVAGLAEQSFGADGVSPGSSLTVLVLGDQATANEPWQLGRYAIPRTHKVLEGRAANARLEEAVLRDITVKCQSARRTNISPIFLGVKQSVADLRAQGCTANSHCELFVDSDLEENVDPSVKKNLNSRVSARHDLPLPIDNKGIEISFCGLAVTTGHIPDASGREARRTSARDSNREDRLEVVWRSLFTNTELVRFEPYCPSASDSESFTASPH